jgi:hypothetical protein
VFSPQDANLADIGVVCSELIEFYGIARSHSFDDFGMLMETMGLTKSGERISRPPPMVSSGTHNPPIGSTGQALGNN